VAEATTPSVDDPVAGLIDIPLPASVSLWPETWASRLAVAIAAAAIVVGIWALLAWAFRRLRVAAHRNNAQEVYSALLDWVRRFKPLAPTGTLAALTARANDPDLDADVAALERELFGPRVDTPVWSARGLLRRAGAARRRLRRA
jgi:hypothetical protein